MSVDSIYVAVGNGNGGGVCTFSIFLFAGLGLFTFLCFLMYGQLFSYSFPSLRLDLLKDIL